MKFLDKDGKQLEDGDYFIYIEQNDMNALIGKIWKTDDDRRDISDLWYYIVWGTNARKEIEYPLSHICNDFHRHRIFKLDNLNFIEEILSVTLTGVQKEFLKRMVESDDDE